MELNRLSRSIRSEYDACGIFSRVMKRGASTRETVDAGLTALRALRHRAGYVHGEGDGCGLMLDLPRTLWQEWLLQAGADPTQVHRPEFFVAHLFLDGAQFDQHLSEVVRVLTLHSVEVLCVRKDVVSAAALGPAGRSSRPLFVQVAGCTVAPDLRSLAAVRQQLQGIPGVDVASLDRQTVIYKVVGDEQTLWRHYSDLQHPAFTSSFVMAHTRFSTNTKTSFARVQPFRTLGHNGEINTILRFYEEAGMLGIALQPDGSDSQMVSGVVEHFVQEFGWSLYETAELIFPPIVHEIKQMPQQLADMYMHLRALWGPFAQGPAAVMMRAGNEAVYSVDALGLRPLWVVETEDAFTFTSEQGVVPAADWVTDPKPLSPGEKWGVTWDGQGVATVHDYASLQELVWERLRHRYDFAGERRSIRSPGPNTPSQAGLPRHEVKPLKIRAAAFGWRDGDDKLLDAYVQTGAEPIKSLGHDAPLPALAAGVRAVSDFLQETVAVVTNPAIDREREMEHFSTRVVLGRRPSFTGSGHSGYRIELPTPLLLEASMPKQDGVESADIQALAHRFGTVCFEDVLADLHDGPYGTVELLIHRKSGESITDCLERLRRAAVEAVQAGANVVVLDDRLQFARGAYVDPFVALAAVHKGLLRPSATRGGEHLRRRTSLVLRSAGLRNLHDIMVALGLGADAVNPYLLWEQSFEKASLQGLENAYKALCKGIEKVISTLGIHELRGYERLFSAIGLREEVADLLGVPTFCATANAGYGFADMEAEAQERQRRYDANPDLKPERLRTQPLLPRIWRAAGQVAEGSLDYAEFHKKLEAIEAETPVSLRHCLDFAGTRETSVGSPVDVDLSIDIHSYPFVISSMSFGSQGEVAYRAYAEAASRLNILGMNGEGGEIKDLLNAYPKHRGRQVASGRFGVNAELCNGAYVLEIKIGQGAKPGEGGHLPGSKVTVQVANARNAAPGIDLISPSNNHDIYSIEDLAQVIYELRTINPAAKIAVKVPVVPNIGTIAVGIVKAGADIVELSGFDGGTGAARAHAIQHVGLPADLGVKLVHEALCEAGLRDVCEIWADGGMKSGLDVVKAMLLGANRVGFGTMAMVAIGCTACRACHRDTCHVGIATQMTSKEEALAKGLKQFEPQEFDFAVERLVRWFTAVGHHVRDLTHQLGFRRAQDMVGRSDLLLQCRKLDAVDLSRLTAYREEFRGMGQQVEYRSWARQEALEAVDEDLAVAGGFAVPVLESSANWVHDESTFSIDSGFTNGRVVEAPRVLGTWESGERVRRRKGTAEKTVDRVYPLPVGNGFAAYQTTGLHSVVYGGAQDGVGKSAYGGRTVILRTRAKNGQWLGGSVGKGLAYGAQRGLFIVQGNADARAGIRLSGADIVIGGELTRPLRDDLGFVGARANIAGFAFEYMTEGRALVLGDPGPWMCSGMTGGSIYVKLNPALGFTEAALRRRIAKGAKVVIRALDDEGIHDVAGLLSAYQRELRKAGQRDAAAALTPLLEKPQEYFVMIRPGKELTDQSIATE